VKRKGDGWRRREQGNGEEEEGKKVGQQFCRLFLPPECGERLVRVFESFSNFSVMNSICVCLAPLDFGCVNMENLVLIVYSSSLYLNLGHNLHHSISQDGEGKLYALFLGSFCIPS
jgi:hypothetical protein